MKMSKAGREKLTTLEGYRRKAYQDSGGVWTIGVGHTGPEVKAGLVADNAQIEIWLSDDLRPVEMEVSTLVTVPLSQHQFDALVMWDFNTGALSRSSVLKVLNKGNYAAAVVQMERWVYDSVWVVSLKGKKVKKMVVIPGLQHRRAQEAAWFTTSDGVSETLAPIYGVKPEKFVDKSIRVKPKLPPSKAIHTTNGRLQIGSAISGAGAAVTGGLAVAQPAINAVHSVRAALGGFAGWGLAAAGTLITVSIAFTAVTLIRKHKSME